ncbi:DUF1552 domain-containing protein [Pseudomonas sp. NPDC089406]|uniref:DUF1552 domain-containing protein n=1 Tax=Pseudomonas sp. NPDC089406 TaxID=3364463 RepID=UPI00384CCA37
MDILKSRRRFLMQLAAAGVMVPLSRSGFAQLAQLGDKQQAKLKVVFFIIPDGLAVDSFSGPQYNGQGLWFPHAQGNDTDDFRLNDVSGRLENYRKDSLYLRGLMVASGQGGHQAWNYVLRDSKGTMSSIDRILGEALPGIQPSLKCLYAGPHSQRDEFHWFVSWDGKTMLTPQDNPQRLYDSVFGVNRRRIADGKQRSGHFFDLIRDQINEVMALVRGSQRERLVTHLDSVEQVEKDLETSLPGSCETFELVNNPINDASYRNKVQQSHHKVVAAALSCGVTRVATIQIARSAESLNILDVSNSVNPHDCAHRYSTEEVWRGSRQWYVDQARLFMDQLASYRDPDVPDDSLLQHTLVVLTSEMADGAPEHMRDMPLLLMGGASGLLRNGSGKGRFFNITDQWDRQLESNPKYRYVDMQRIWATLADAAGTRVPYEGNIDLVTGIFSNVT